MEKLKFELVNGFGVLVDENAKIEKGKTFLTKEGIPHTNYWYNYGDRVIIFAEQELNLDGVPVFEWRDFEAKKLAESSYGEKESDADTDITLALAKGYINGFIEGYKSNLAKYTKDDLENSIDYIIRKFAEEYQLGKPKTISEYQKEVFQFLEKYPQYIIMESEAVNDFGEPYSFDDMDFGVEKEYKLKLFTNSYGKQQGIIKEIIY